MTTDELQSVDEGISGQSTSDEMELSTPFHSPCLPSF